jgi:acyl-coenzyme A synthetase/AMP-(fatty) acid ligase
MVMREEDTVPEVSQVRSYLRDKLAPYKHPRRILPVDEIPRTPATGQIKRTLLRQTLTDGDARGR